VTETSRKLNLSPRVKRYVLLLAAACTLWAAPGFAGEARTQEAPVVIGVGFDFPPYEFLDENGKAAGYNVELTEAIAEVMELDVEVKIGPWGNIRDALEAGRIDAVAGMLYSVERDKLVDFSPPHAVIHHAIFVRRDALPIKTEEDLRGKEIIVTRGNIMHDYVLEKGLSDNPILADTQADTLRLLASGQHDCAMVAKLPGLYWLRELGLSNIEIAGPLAHPSDYSYAVTEGNATLLARLSEGLAIVGQTSRYKEIYDKWLGVLEPRGVPLNTILKYIVLALASILLLFVAVWSRTLKRQVARRTAELSDEVTERKRAEEALHKSKERLRQIIDLVPAQIFAKDREGRILLANRAVAETLGMVPEQMTGRMHADIHPDAEEVARMLADDAKVIERGQPLTISKEPYLNSAGERRWMRTTKVPYVAADTSAPAILGVATDITERIRAEEERRKLDVQMQRMQRLESLGVLAGGLAHDFNNLLTSILGNAEMALETLPESSPAWQRIAHIEKASLNAADLCSQMLAYAGKGKFIVGPTKLNKVVEEMAHLLRTSVSKNVVLNLRLEDSLPPVEADATQMQQVVMNLVTNAWESIGEDSGVVTVTTGVMDCDCAYLSRSYLHDDLPEGRYVYIDVADTGCGMDKSTQAKVFEPFFTTKFTGRGLGLAAVLGIIRGHGGAIEVDSQPGRGTTVKVLFPALDHYEPVQTEPQQSLEEPVYTFSGVVLVVDDEESVRDVGKFMLETAGFDVITAQNGYEALEIYRKNADVIVCVLLDLTMPHMDGIKVFEQLMSIRDDVRVVLASGYSEEEISKRYARTGIAGFIHKPYLFSTLKAKLHEALHK